MSGQNAGVPREHGHYEYHGLMAETWDLLRGDPSGRFDEDFYRQMIARYGEPVLDLGCGTGRLLLAFLQSGVEIDGVDLSPEMLGLCRAKAGASGLVAALYEQSLEELDLPRQYRTILAPSSVLQLIPDPGAVRQAMRRIVAHLAMGGVLVAPFMTLWRAGMPLQREWESAAYRADGALLQRMGRVRYDLQTECEDTEDLYQVIVDGETVAAETHRRSPANRSYTQEQARALFVECGLVDVKVFSGFTLDEACGDEMLFVVVGVRCAF